MKNLLTLNYSLHQNSDKTVRLFKWVSGSGFEEDKNSPFLGHKYAVTKVEFSPQVNDLLIIPY